MNGFTGRSGLVMRGPGAAPDGAAGGGGAGGAAGAAGGRSPGAGAARGAGAGGGAAGRTAGACGGGAGAGTARGAGGGAARGGAGGGPGSATGARCAAPEAAFTGNTLLHTAQRARTPPAGTLDGSTRYTVSHDGQVTFIWRPPRLHRAPGRAGGRPRTPTPVVFSRSSSSPWRARSLEPGVRNGGAGSS